MKPVPGLAARWLRHPAVHFVLAGAALFALDAGVAHLRATDPDARALSPPPAPHASASTRPQIVLSAARMRSLREAFTRRTARPPTPSEMRGLIEGVVTEELLFRRALALGLDRGEPAVRGRILQKARFVVSNPGRSDDDLLREARGLGLDRDDPVIRRILAEKMRLVLAGSGQPEPVTDAELFAWLSRHRGRFMAPARVRISQVFLLGNASESRATRMLASLRARGQARPDDPLPGDPLPLAGRNAWMTGPELAAIFGTAFAGRVMALPSGRWDGPLRSPYGAHLVWIHEKRSARPLPLESVRSQVAQALLGERQETRVRAGIARLRAAADVRIEPETRASRSGAPGGGRS